MTAHEIFTTGISVLSLVVSFFALQRSSRDSAKSNEISGHSLRTAHGQIEIDLRKMINDSKHRVEDLFSKNGDFLALPKDSLSPEESARRERIVTQVKSAIEGYLSALDSACGKYLDRDKIDNTRFKKDYKREVRQAVQDKAHKEFLEIGHAYNALTKVYEEWENPENG